MFRNYIKGDIFATTDPIYANKFGLPEVSDQDIRNSWTYLDENLTIAGCGGFRFQWFGLYECWLSAKSYEVFYRHKIEVFRFIRSRFKTLKARRFQATISVDQPTHVNFIRHLGFHYEATMRKFGPDGKDYYLFALVK